jgi:hypothetical protein
MDALSPSMTPEQLVAATGMSLDEARHTLDVANGAWASDVIEVDERGNERPAMQGDNYRPGM